MRNSIVKKEPLFISPLAKFFSRPDIALLSQATPISAGIAAYLSTGYSQEQYKVLETFVHELHEAVKEIEETKIDYTFLESEEGKRTIGKIFRLVIRDNQKEKIKIAATLSANIYQKSEISFSERELYSDILDGLNTLQLAILSRSVETIRSRQQIKHRGVGWQTLSKEFAQVGISEELLLQSIRVLESNGLLNKNDAGLQEADQTHFITTFGEQFFDFTHHIRTSSSQED